MDAGHNFEDRTIVTTRILEAPPALVFDAFSNPDHLARWWGPNGFSITTTSFDMRPGGDWRFVMHGPDGRDYGNIITFEVIDRPHSLAYSHRGDGDTAHIHFTNSFTFEDLGGRTLLTMRAEFDTAPERDFVIRHHKADEGGRQTLGRLAAMLEEDTFAFTRTFDAPRELVWSVWTNAEHLAKWWGPKGFTWISGTLDLKPGGMFHYGMTGPNGKEMWGRFIFHEIVAPERLVFVNSFSDPEGAVTRAPFFADWPLEVYNVLTLTEADGKTVMSLRGCPINAAEGERARFREMKPSMNQGWSGSIEQLTAYLKSLKQ